MPKFDYTIKWGRIDIPACTYTEKGTVEAPDSHVACLVAYVDMLGEVAVPWKGDAAQFLKDNKIENGQIIENWTEGLAEDVVRDEDLSVESDLSFSAKYQDVDLYSDDYMYEVAVYRHDPERYRKHHTVDVEVALKVSFTGTGECEWESLKQQAKYVARAALEAFLAGYADETYKVELRDVST